MKNKKIIIISAISALVISATIISITLITKITKKEYEVYFDVAGGSKIEIQQVEKNEKVVEPKDPVKLGFIFKGWYYNGEKFDFNQTITQDITLIAKWEADGTTTIYTVEFDSAGGSLVNAIEISEGEAITEPKEPTKENFVFDGWYFGESKFDFSIRIMQNITLTAKWVEASNNESIQVNNNSNSNNNSNNLNNQNTQNNGNTNSSYNIAEQYSKLSGTWYLKGFEQVYLEIVARIANNNIMYVVSWNNIDLLGNCKPFNDGTISSVYLEEFLNKFNPKVNNSELNISNGNNSLIFSRQKTIFDTSKYNNFVGKWYLPGFGEQVYVQIIKEGEKSYRIKCNNFNTTTANKQDGHYTEYAEEIYEMVAYNKNTIFDKNNITLTNGVLYIGTGANKKEFSKTPSTTIYNVTGVSLGEIETSIKVGQSKKFTANIQPSNATNKAVTWSSSDTSVAIINEDGVMETRGLGTTTITVMTVDGNYADYCFVTVLAIPVEGISLSLNNVNMNVGETREIHVTITPKYADLSTNVVWESSNPNVAIVESYGSGLIVAKGEGQAILTARTGENKSATCTVNVSKVDVQKITLNYTSLDLAYRKSDTLTALISPDNATNKKITWTSSNSDIVEVNDKGELYAVTIGTATITAKSEDGVEATCVVNVFYEPIVVNAKIEHYIIENEYGKREGVKVEIESITGGNGKYSSLNGYYRIFLAKDGKTVATGDYKVSRLFYDDFEGGTFTGSVYVVDSAGNVGEWRGEITY